VEIAYYQRCMGWPRRAAALLLQWLFGLRPTELTELRGRDLYPRSRHYWTGGVGFIKLGALRGTKAGRPQIVRAPHHEFWANFILEMLAGATPPDSRLSDFVNGGSMNAALAASSHALGYDWTPTAHCARAGWASARFARGQPVPDLMEDGRWRSVNSMRIYIDAVSAVDMLARVSPTRLSYMVSLEAQMHVWLRV